MTQSNEEKYREKINQAWKFYSEDNETDALALCAQLRSDYPQKLYYEYIEALIAIKNKRYKNAEKFLLNILHRDHDGLMTGEVCYMLSNIYNEGCYNSDKASYYVYDKSKAKYYHEKSRKAKETPIDIYRYGYSYYSDGERIVLYKEAIAKYPEESVFYINLAQQYRRNENFKQELRVYKDAIENEVTSASLYWNLAWYYFTIGDFATALNYYLESAKRIKEEYDRWSVYYMVGVCHKSIGDIESAETFFKKSLILTAEHHDCWFGLISLLSLYAETGNDAAIHGLLNEFLITEEKMSDGSLTGGPVWLSPDITDSIYFEPSLDKAYKFIKKIKVKGLSNLQLGKLWFIRFILTRALEKEDEIHQALKKTLLLIGSYNYDFIINELATSHRINIHVISKDKDKLESAVNDLIKDLDEYYTLKEAIVSQLEEIFSNIYDAKLYQLLINLSAYFTQHQLEEANLLFELAYSSSKLGNDDKAYKLYLRLFEVNPKSTGACNNLGVIAESWKDYAQAVEWYEKGLTIDSQDELLRNNLKSSLQKLSKQEEDVKEKRKLEQEHMQAIALLKKESDFALDKLRIFLLNIKKESGFKDGKLPIPKNRFPQLMGAQKQFADSLRDQWISRKYIIETGERNEFQVMVYTVNPHIEAELARLENYKVPAHWIDGITSMTPEKLEQHYYFLLIEKIKKANKKFCKLLERDYNELVFNSLVGNEKATIVLSGSLIELVLTYYFEKKKMMTIPVSDKGTLKPKKLYNCVLSDLIDHAERQKLFGNDFPHLSNLSRIYRNYIHPGRELKEQLDKTKADLCFISVTEILKRVL